MMIGQGTRLYYSTDSFSGEVGELLTMSMEHRHYVPDCFASRLQDAGTVDLTIRGHASELVNLFHTSAKVLWTAEMPTRASFAFDGYVESIEQNCCFADVTTRIKVRILGPVTMYYDGPDTKTPDTSDVFSRKASRLQSKVMAETLQKVTTTQKRVERELNSGWPEDFEEFD